MSVLIPGLLLFFAVHTITALRPVRTGLIERLGDKGYRIVYSVLSLIGIVLIAEGYSLYRAAGYIEIWSPPRAMRHPAALLMWPAFVALAAAYAPVGLIRSRLKHPMLVGVKTWALAHLLANGDLGSILLFGSFLAWAVFDRISVKRRGDAGPAPTGFGRGDVIALAVGTIAYVGMTILHVRLIGVPVFG
jgi:uncharacterized membrane protein